MNDTNLILIQKAIRDVPDFPKEGILFKDITPILEDNILFSNVIDIYASCIQQYSNISRLVAIESRGFIFASALAYKLKIGITLLRKNGKLPYKTIQQCYDLEYGTDCLEVHEDSIPKGTDVIIIDDLLATGGTVTAAVQLVKKCGANPVAAVFLIELSDLLGKERILKNGNINIHSIIKY